MPEHENAAHIWRFIADQTLGVLGTLSPEGQPQAALVGIAVTPELDIIFDTVAHSRKYRNLALNPACSFVIGWDSEVTVQYEGRARQPVGAELARYQEQYFARWPDGPSRLLWPGIAYFVVQPTWVRYSDFGQTPALVQELTYERDLGRR